MLRDRKDRIQVKPLTGPPRPGDVILFQRPSGALVLHRVLLKRGQAYLVCGDNQYFPEWVPKTWVLGQLTAFYRGRTLIKSNELCYKLYSWFMVTSFPMRTPLLFVARRLQRRTCQLPDLRAAVEQLRDGSEPSRPRMLRKGSSTQMKTRRSVASTENSQRLSSDALASYRNLIIVIRHALDVDYEGAPDCSGWDWGLLKAQADKHMMTSLAFAGVQKLQAKGACSMPAALARRWHEDSILRQVISETQRKAFQQIVDAFEENKIPYMPMKGLGLAVLYPEPRLREMSDLDFYVDESKVHNAAQLLRELGYGVSAVKTTSETRAKRGPIRVELHTALFFAAMPGTVTSYFEHSRLLQACPHQEANGPLCMDATDTYLYAICHFSKHLTFSGTGIRSLLDLWLLRSATADQVDHEVVEARLDDFGFLTDYWAAMTLADNWFGPQRPNPDLPLEQYVFSSGIHGSWEHLVHNRVLDKGQVGSYIFSRFFPPKKILVAYHATEVSGISPFSYAQAWLKRTFQVLIRRRGSARAELSAALSLMTRTVDKLQERSASEGDAPHDTRLGAIAALDP